MNYAGMQRDILELFTEASRGPAARAYKGDVSYQTWSPGDFSYRILSPSTRAHRRAVKKTWRRRITYDLRVARAERVATAVRQELEAILEGRAPPPPTVQVAACPSCGHRLERRQGTERWQHVGVQKCAASRPDGLLPLDRQSKALRGECIDCLELAVPGMRRCETCRQAHNARERRRVAV